MISCCNAVAKSILILLTLKRGMLQKTLTSPGLCIALHIDDNQDPPPIPIKCVVTEGKCLKPESPKEVVKSWKFPSSKHRRAQTIPTSN